MSFNPGFVPAHGVITPNKKKTMNILNRKYKNTPIRIGCITKVYEIDDENNTSDGTVVQYDVVTEELGEKGENYVEYPRCIALDSIGGIGDFFEYKLRTSDSEEFTKSHQFKKQNGSMVAILCIDGFGEKGLIIGGIKHPNRKTTLTKDAGLHLEGEYNGLNWKINKDGELNITFKSATDNEGKPKDETAGGTHFQIDKEGSIDINTNLEGDEETYIRMDKKNKDVGLKAGANVGFTAKKDVTTNADGKITGKAKGSIEFTAEGTAKVSAKSSLTLEGESEVTIKGGSLTLDTPKIFTYASQTFLGGKVYVGDGGAPAVIGQTQFEGKGNHGAPVISKAIGPFSGNVFIAS
jgi:hypothetical protein